MASLTQSTGAQVRGSVTAPMALRLPRGRRSNLRSRREPLGWPGGGGGTAHDQARGEHDLARGGTAAFQPLYRQVDGLRGLLACVLADRGEVHVGSRASMLSSYPTTETVPGTCTPRRTNASKSPTAQRSLDV